LEPAQNNNTRKNPFEYLAEIDALLMAQQPQQAANRFAELLCALGVDWYKSRYSLTEFDGGPLHAAGEVCERAALQWQQILASNIDVSQLPVSTLALYLSQLHFILAGSKQGNLDGFMRALHARCGGKFQPEQLIRLVLAWCPTSRLGMNIFQFHGVLPDLVVAQAIATISGVALVGAHSRQALDQALALLSEPGDISLDVVARFGVGLQTLEAWMRCSYADNPDKHKVKPFLTRYIEKTMALSVGKMPVRGEMMPLRGAPDKPLLVVPLESFSDTHAMFRCYADVLEACRTDFYTVGLALKDSYNAGTAAVFDEFFDIKDICDWDERLPVDIRRLVETVRAWRPVAVFYPSLGMKQWTIELAQHRLAPVQAMTIGHPASSHCAQIDYVLVESTFAGAHQNYTEKVVELPAPSLRHRLPEGAPRVSPLAGPPSDGVVRIAIPSMAQKLSADFVAALRYVEQHATRPFRFVFTLGVQSTLYWAVVNQLRHELKNVEFYPNMGYQEYIEVLNRCQLHAGTFPFGGTNSLIDSLRQGLPILALQGDQPHSRIDDDFIRRVGLPDTFICHSPDAYAQRLLALIENPEELYHWREKLLAQGNVDALFLQQGHPEVFRQALARLVAEEGSAEGRHG